MSVLFGQFMKQKLSFSQHISVPNTAEIFIAFLRLNVSTTDYFRDTTGIHLLSSRSVLIIVLGVNLLFSYISFYIYF